MKAPFGFQIFPYSAENGEVVKWNAVIYDLRNPQPGSGKEPRYRFVRLVPPQPSPDAVREMATRIIRAMIRPTA